MLPLPSDHHKKLPGFLVEIGLGLYTTVTEAYPTRPGWLKGPAD